LENTCILSIGALLALNYTLASLIPVKAGRPGDNKPNTVDQFGNPMYAMGQLQQ